MKRSDLRKANYDSRPVTLKEARKLEAMKDHETRVERIKARNEIRKLLGRPLIPLTPANYTPKTTTP